MHYVVVIEAAALDAAAGVNVDAVRIAAAGVLSSSVLLMQLT